MQYIINKKFKTYKRHCGGNENCEFCDNQLSEGNFYRKFEDKEIKYPENCYDFDEEYEKEVIEEINEAIKDGNKEFADDRKYFLEISKPLQRTKFIDNFIEEFISKSLINSIMDISYQDSIYISHCNKCHMIIFRTVVDHSPCCPYHNFYYINEFTINGSKIEGTPLFTENTINFIKNNNVSFSFAQLLGDKNGVKLGLDNIDMFFRE